MAVSRRDFLKGSLATGAAAVTGAALAGCSPSSSSEGSDSSNSSGSSSSGEQLHTWEVTPDAITDIADTKDYDIVIVGAGIAGNSAAEAAARNGASVVVIEQTESIQGHGCDVAAPGSRYKVEEEGVDIDIATACRLLFQWSQQTANYSLIRTWGDQVGPVMDYVEDVCAQYGVYMVPADSQTSKTDWGELSERWRIYPDAVWFVTDDEPGQTRSDGYTAIYNLLESLYASASENGAEYVFNTHAEQLVGDAESGITGVIATAEDGSYVQYNASKGVILATGDIGGNQEMIDCFAPICNRADGNVYTPAGYNTGDGILMGCWAGAGMSKSPAAPMIHQVTNESMSFNLTSFVMSWLSVNRNGDRYGAEIPFEPYVTNARTSTPGSVAWSIFDANYATYVQKQWPEKYEALLDGIEEEMEARLESGDLFKADTIDDLADQIGVPAENLNAAVENYNQMYAQGEDTQFGVPEQFLSEIKTAPFYATPNVCSTLVVPFGLHVDENSQVCTEDDDPIDGLFAIGNVQGDFFAFSYPVHCPGISHSRCVTFGELVGEALAKDTVLTENEFE